MTYTYTCFILHVRMSILYLPHFQKDLSDLSAYLHQGMEVASSWWNTKCIEVVRLETLSLPRTTEIIIIIINNFIKFYSCSIYIDSSTIIDVPPLRHNKATRLRGLAAIT